jgi:hypothetical protein
MDAGRYLLVRELKYTLSPSTATRNATCKKVLGQVLVHEHLFATAVATLKASACDTLRSWVEVSECLTLASPQSLTFAWSLPEIKILSYCLSKRGAHISYTSMLRRCRRSRIETLARLIGSEELCCCARTT